MRGKATIKVTLHNIDIETSLPEDSLNYLNTQGTIPTLCKQLQQSIECIRATHINIKQLVKLKISEHKTTYIPPEDEKPYARIANTAI